MAKMKRRGIKATPWLPKMYKNATVVQRAVIYLALHPGTYFSSDQLSALVSVGWPTVNAYLMRLSTVGLVHLQACYKTPGTNIYSDRACITSGKLEIPERLHDMPRRMPVIGYAATPELVARVASGKFLQMLGRQQSGPINDRLIHALAKVHPDSMAVNDLKHVTEVSAGCPDIAKRLEHLDAKGWVNILTRDQFWDGKAYWGADEWTVQLSAGGWLRIQRARRDGSELQVPKPKKKPKKKKETVAV